MKRSLFKDIASVFGSNVFALFAGLLVGIVLARVLGPEGKGTYTALTVVPAIVVSFTALGMRRTAVYFIGRKDSDPSLIASSVITILIFSALLGMLVTIAVFFFLDNPQFTPLYIGLVTLVIPLRLGAVYIAGIYLGKENFRFANMLKWMIPLLNLILVIILVWGASGGITGAILAMLLASLIVSVLAITRLSRDFHLRITFRRDILRRMIRLGILYATSFLIMKLIYRVDVILLEHFSSLKEVGYYSIAVNIAERIWQLPMAMGIVIMSRSANEKIRGEMESSLGSLLRLSLISGMLGAVALYFLAPLLVPLLYGRAFGPGSVMLQTILPGIILFIVFRLLNSRLNGLGKPLVAIYSAIPALVINVALNVLWIPDYGGTGAAMATNVSYIAATVILVWRYTAVTGTSAKALLMPQKRDYQMISNKINKLLKR